MVNRIDADRLLRADLGQPEQGCLYSTEGRIIDSVDFYSDRLRFESSEIAYRLHRGVSDDGVDSAISLRHRNGDFARILQETPEAERGRVFYWLADPVNFNSPEMLKHLYKDGVVPLPTE